MKLKLFQIDAFTDSVFSGNPAAVCPLDEWLPEATMQAIAAHAPSRTSTVDPSARCARGGVAPRSTATRGTISADSVAGGSRSGS